MNQTIKKRIEEINNGIVPEGYEKTSFGIFPCDWEKDKSLGDICEINPKTEALPNEFIYIDLESVVDGKLIQENVIENAKAPSRAQRVLQKNDIIYQMVRPYQKNNFIFIQDDGSFKCVASTGYAQLRSDNYVFLYQMVNSEYFCTQVLKKCTGTNYPAINSQDLAEVNCAYPKDEQEQSRIAEILMQWDKAIELQEKLIEAYQKSKKYYLNKMFPKKGSNVPEIRFPGFTAPWEQRKVENIADIMGGNAWKSQDYDEFGDYLVITIANVKGDISIDDTIGNKIKSSASNPYVLKTGDILISLTGNVGRVSKMTKIQAVLNQRVGKVKFKNKEVEPSFAFHLLHNPRFESSMIEAGQGAAQKNISNKDVLNYGIKIPIHNLEQQKISTIFDSIDNLITLHQQKRDKLVAQRKAMQQYLLTGIVRVL